jgi:hypothetical protein
MKAFRHAFKKLMQNYLRVCGKDVEIQEIFVFEPVTFLQKVDALYQNTMEIQLIIAIILLLFLSPSGIAVGFLVLTHDMLLSATYKSETRLEYGKKIMLFNFIVLLFVIIKKYTILKHFQG